MLIGRWFGNGMNFATSGKHPRPFSSQMTMQQQKFSGNTSLRICNEQTVVANSISQRNFLNQGAVQTCSGLRMPETGSQINRENLEQTCIERLLCR